MKATKLLLLILSFALLLPLSHAMAQISIGAELGLPLGDFSTVSNPGFGISGRYEASIKDNINWTASLGYLSYGGKDYSGGSYGTVSIIPITGGAKYYFNQVNNGFYGAADLGFSFVNYSVTIPGFGSSSSSSTKLVLAPGVGYRMGNWDFTARFNLQSDFNYFGIRAAYILNVK